MEKKGSLKVFLTDPHSASQDYLEQMARFVKSHHPRLWPRILLNECFLLEVKRKDETVALVWFAPLTDEILECHACADPKWRGRWLTRETVGMLSLIVDHTDCKSIIAQVTSPLVRRVWKALGFTIYNTIAIREFE